jgi:hypothetical protein
VYYIDATQGFYYAILTPKTLRAFYLDSSGNTIYVTVYRWDLNTSWIIFQAPLSTRIYLREESYAMGTFATPSSWFSASAVAVGTPYYNVSATFPVPWSAARFTTIYPQNSTVSIVKWFDGSSVFVRNTTRFNFNNTYSVELSASTTTNVSASTSYTATFSLAVYNSAPAASITGRARGAYSTNFYYPVTNFCSSGTKYDRLYQSAGGDQGPIYEFTLTYSSTSSSVTITTSSSTIQESYRCWAFNAINNTYIVQLNLTLSATSASFYTDKQYYQSNNIITTDTGNKIHVAGPLETLPYASVVGLSSSSTYYVYTRSVTISSNTRQDWTKPIVLIYDSSGGTTTLSITNVTIQPGDAIAPHLYKWHFNGVNGYIQVPYLAAFNQNPFTVMGWVLQELLRENPMFGTGDSYATDRYLHAVIRNGYAYLGFFSDDLQSSTQLQTNWWYFLAFAWEGPTTKKQLIYVDAALDSTRTSSGLLTVTTGSGTGNGGWIGKWSQNYFKGFIAQVLIYSRALSGTEIYNAYAYNIISSSDLTLFLDPTFYNGTHYIDISGNNNHGTPYGGVSRVLDSRQWLYLVKNRYNDGLLHLQWFPGGSKIYLFSGSNLVASYVVPGSPSQQVPDYAVSIPSGYVIDRVLAYIPMQSSQADYQVVRSPNPAAILYSPLTGVAPIWLFNYPSSITVAVTNPPNVYNNSQITLDLVYTYPTRYTKPALDVFVAQGGDLVSLFPISGSVQANPSYVYVNGFIDLSNYVGSTVILDVSGSYNISGQASSGYIGSYLAVYPQSSGVTISGTFNISVAKADNSR